MFEKLGILTEIIIPMTQVNVRAISNKVLQFSCISCQIHPNCLKGTKILNVSTFPVINN